MLIRSIVRSYVVLSVASSFLVASWHGFRIGPFRKAAKCAYPIHYAVASPGKELTKAEYLFNCAQRAHGNFLEHYATFLVAVLIAGLKYPVAAAVSGFGWLVSRIAYAVGYTLPSKDRGQGRVWGVPFQLFELGLIGMAGKVGWDMLS